MDIYSALGDPTRRRIIELIAANGLISVTDISRSFEVSQPAISQHLKVLRVAKLVDMEKRAQQRLYSINTERMQEAEEWIHRMTKRWNNRLDVLDTLLQEEKRKLARKEV